MRYKTWLEPLCPKCGFVLAAKVSTKFVVCVICDIEYLLVEKSFFSANVLRDLR